MHSTDNGIEPGVDQPNPAALRTAGLSVTGPIPGPVSAAANNVISAASGTSGLKECAGCGKRITERFLLKALELFWHEDCLKCGCCDCRLGEVGSTLYTKANLILCKRDYLRLFGTTGYCAACNKVIPAFEMVMRAKNNVYHLECFACQQCNHRFCVGDRFYLCENKILCEYDYEERLVFANMAYNPSSLAHIRSGKTLAEQPRLRTSHHPTPMGVANVFNNAHLIARPDQSITIPSHHIGFPLMGLVGGSVSSMVEGGPRPAGVPSQGNLEAPIGRGVGPMDDGSSGYGSPDSETLDVALPSQQ